MRFVITICCCLAWFTAGAEHYLGVDLGLGPHMPFYKHDIEHIDTDEPGQTQSFSIGYDYQDTTGLLFGGWLKSESRAFPVAFVHGFPEHMASSYLRFNYLALSITAGYAFQDPFNIYLRGGIQPAYFYRGTLSEDHWPAVDFNHEGMDPLEVDAIFEAGYRYVTGRSVDVLTGARFNLGLIEQELQEPLEEQTYRNRSLTLFLQIQMKLDR